MIKLILLMIALIASIVNCQTEQYTFEVNFNGSTCTICGVDNFQYTLNGDTVSAFFTDPLPQNSVLVSYTVATTAMYWCGGNNILATIANGSAIQLTNGYHCTCGMCPPVSTGTSSTFQNGVPGYSYGGNNIISVYNPFVSNGGSVGVAVLTVTLTYTNGHTGNMNASVSVPYTGCGYCKLCGSDTYSLSNMGADCGEGLWDDGFRYFQDPVPRGSTVTQITVATTGVFWCEPPSSANFTVNGVLVGSSQVREHSECFCDTCPGVEYISSKVFSSGFPMYMYGSVNSIQVGVMSGVVGVQNLELIITYSMSGRQYEVKSN